MKAIAHANNWLLTLAFHIIFTRVPVNITLAQAQVSLGVAMPLVSTISLCFFSLCIIIRESHTLSNN